MYCNFFALGCVTMEICIIWKFVTWKTALLWTTALLEDCVTLKDCVTWKSWYLKNCVTLRNCVTCNCYLKFLWLWKIVFLEKLRYFEKLWYFEKLTFFWITMLLERLRWGALLVKYCVGVRYFRNFFTVKMLRCLKNDFLWILRY